MFENIKIEECPYAPDRVRVRFKLDEASARKLRPIVEPYFMMDEEMDALGGNLKSDSDVSVYYGIDEWGPGQSDELTVSLTYDDGEDGRLDGTNTKIDFDRAWAQFLAPLRQIKDALAA